MLSVNFALLEFQLKYQAAETLLQCQIFFYSSVALGGFRGVSTSLPSLPKINFAKIYYKSWRYNIKFHVQY